MSDTLGTNWLNNNALRNYPISQTASCVSSEGSFSIPDNLFVDMKLAIPFVAQPGTAITGISPSSFYISSIKVYPQGFMFFVGCSLNSKIAASEPISFSSFTENTTIAIKGVAVANLNANQLDFSQVYGFATIGSIDGLKNLTGDITFNLADSRLESSVISYGPRRISGIKVYSDANTSALLSGQIMLRSGSNHRMEIENTNNGSNVILNAIRGEDFQETCPCNDVDLGPCIRTINGRPPNASGNFEVKSTDCIEVTEGSNSILLKDTCAKPCCGCNELNVLTGDVDALTSQLALLQGLVGTLTGYISNLQDTCLASRVNWTSCSSEEDSEDPAP